MDRCQGEQMSIRAYFRALSSYGHTNEYFQCGHVVLLPATVGNQICSVGVLDHV